MLCHVLVVFPPTPFPLIVTEFANKIRSVITYNAHLTDLPQVIEYSHMLSLSNRTDTYRDYDAWHLPQISQNIIVGVTHHCT